MNLKYLALVLLAISLVTPVWAANEIFYTTAPNDGYTTSNTGGSTWAFLRDGAGTDFSSTSVIIVDAYTAAAANNYTYIHRGVLIFDTSALPDGALITGATISIFTQATSTAAGDVGIGITNFTQDGAISADDYNNFGTTRFATDKNVSTLGASQYYDWPLNSLGLSNISKTGNSSFSVMTQWDIDNETMPWQSLKRTYYAAYGCDYSSCSVPPKLNVTYTIPPVAAFSANVTNGRPPLHPVGFTDASTNSPTDWDWYWYANETKSSDEQNPSTTFATGTHNVRLYAANPGGGDWENKTAYITVDETSAIVDYLGNPLSGTPSLLVSFADLTDYGISPNTTCNWSFGDPLSTQAYSSTCGNAQHVYSYSGVYDVNYSVTNDAGTWYEYKYQYITVSSDQIPSYVVPTQPRSIRFTIVDAYGNDLSGATVVANYVADTLPSTDINWLVSAFGVSTDVASEMRNGSVAMSGVTGSDGSLSFIMYPVLQYQLTITNVTAGLSKTVTLYPQDTDYVIYCTLTSQVAPVSRVTQMANSTIYVTEPNSSWVTFNVVYQDTSQRTNALHWNVTCLTNFTVVYTHDFGDPDDNVMIDNFTVSTEPRGTEYRAMYAATRSW